MVNNWTFTEDKQLNQDDTGYYTHLKKKNLSSFYTGEYFNFHSGTVHHYDYRYQLNILLVYFYTALDIVRQLS
jgi:hypothetical protein